MSGYTRCPNCGEDLTTAHECQPKGETRTVRVTPTIDSLRFRVGHEPSKDELVADLRRQLDESQRMAVSWSHAATEKQLKLDEAQARIAELEGTLKDLRSDHYSWASRSDDSVRPFVCGVIRKIDAALAPKEGRGGCLWLG